MPEEATKIPRSCIQVKIVVKLRFYKKKKQNKETPIAIGDEKRKVCNWVVFGEEKLELRRILVTCL